MKKVKAFWKSKNPFRPNIEDLGYSKIIEVPSDTDMEELEDFAKEDSMEGYRFDRFEILAE